jgi:hypothetical protein
VVVLLQRLGHRFALHQVIFMDFAPYATKAGFAAFDLTELF